MGKIALITGITGQDGSYLAEYLLNQGYEVHGLRRRSSSFNTGRIEHLIQDDLIPAHQLYYGDLADFSSLAHVISKVGPGEIYHLGAQSHVGVSFENPEYTGNVDALGTLRILEVIRALGSREIRLYQASTSELYGKNEDTPQDELTPFKPCSPYALAKSFAFGMVQLYRESYGLFASNGILFNHESPRRGETFVSRKITRHVAETHNGSDKILNLGNLYAVRDWGHAKDFVKGMHAILNHKEADDFVLATNKGHTVKDFVNLAFSLANIQLIWEGNGLNEFAVDSKSGKKMVQVNKDYYRPSEVNRLIGSYAKAKTILNWSPIISFEELVQEMVESDIKLMEMFKAR